MTRSVCLATFLIVVPVLAVADQYWIAYEGDDFPENEGWIRDASDPPAQRWLENGSLFVDSRADVHMYENYYMTSFSDGVDPDPGEMFVMRWRLMVHKVFPWEDPGVYVLSDESYEVIFLFGEGHLLSLYEPDVYVDFESGVFHEFELRSADMRSYELYVDDRLAVEGEFFEGSFPGCVGWGDIVRGSSSLAAWDYFRFGVVPEASGWLMLVIALAYIPRRKI